MSESQAHSVNGKAKPGKKKLGRPAKQDAERLVNVPCRVLPATKKALNERAAYSRCSPSSLARELLKKSLEQQP